MKIGLIVAHPTQFEGPFFQYAARDAAHKIHVVYTDPDRMEQIYDPELSANVSWGIDLLSGYPYSLVPRRGRIAWLARDIIRQKYDLLIINGYSKSEYIIATLLARLHGTPTALRLDSVRFRKTSMFRRLLKRTGFLALRVLYRHFFATGSLTVEYLEHYGVRRECISIFSYVVDNDYFQAKSKLTEEAKVALKGKYGVPNDKAIILSVAKFNRREAPWDLMHAYISMPDPKPYLLLVGDGEQRSALEEYARTHPDLNVIFAGYVRYPELPALYGIADIFVHPAHDEPWGVSVNEALACGLPVVASSRVGAGYDLILPDRNGAIYQVGNPDELRDKLVQFISHRPEDVRRENENILSRWNYATSWRNILEAGSKLRRSQA